MDYGLGFLGEYITAAELVGKTPTLTINKVTLEKVESLKEKDTEGGGKMKDKIVIYFAESKSGRGWLLNRTNAEAIKEMWGRETNEWLGHKITLFTQQVKVGPKIEPGIRVKGSPELTAPKVFELRLPRKKPVSVTLLPTGRSQAQEAPKDEPDDAELTDAPPEPADAPRARRSAPVGPTIVDALAAVDRREDDLANDIGRSLNAESRAKIAARIAAREGATA